MSEKMVFIYATSKCNHKCSHCYIGYPGAFDPEELYRCVLELRKEYRVIVNGAEVLTNIAYLKSFKAAGQRFLFSNGIVFAGERGDTVIDEMERNGIDTVRLSHHFSAIKELHGVDSAVVERAIQKLQSRNICVELHTTITATNFCEIEQICEYAVKNSIRRVKFFLLQKVGNALNLDAGVFLTPEQIKQFYEQVKYCREKYDIDTLKIRVDGDLKGLTKKFNCTYGEDALAITPNRLVFGCPFAVGNREPIGYLSPENKLVIEKKVIHDGQACYLNRGQTAQ